MTLSILLSLPCVVQLKIGHRRKGPLKGEEMGRGEDSNWLEKEGIGAAKADPRTL